jgi:zinc transporter 1/2/3
LHPATGIFPAEIVVVESEKVGDSEKQENRGGRVHIVGMRAHAAAHSHSHPEGHHECADITHEHVHGHVGHTHGVGSISDEGLARIRHVVIAQVNLLFFVLWSYYSSCCSPLLT